MTRLLLVCVTAVSAACASTANPLDDQSGLTGDGKADGGGTTGGLKSGKLSWTCHNAGTLDNSNFAITLVHQGKTNISETIAGYHVIENSTKRADSDIGHD